MAQNYVSLIVEDGTSMGAYTAVPPGRELGSGLLLLQEAFGVNRHIRNLADRFAKEGYVVIAPELFHRTAPVGFEGSYTDFSQVVPHMQALSAGGLEADIRAAWKWIEEHPQLRAKGTIGAIGYCMGGRTAFLANAILPCKAAVSYYGGRIAPELIDRAPALHGPMLFFWGGLDTHIPEEQISAVVGGLKKAGKPFINVVIADADHGFFCDERKSYNAEASREAWALTTAFLRDKLA